MSDIINLQLHRLQNSPFFSKIVNSRVSKLRSADCLTLSIDTGSKTAQTCSQKIWLFCSLSAKGRTIMYLEGGGGGNEKS